MEKKQTAVQWLQDIVNAMIENGGDLWEDFPALQEHLTKALQMEREQIEEVFQDGWDDNSENLNTPLQEYYNKKFN